MSARPVLHRAAAQAVLAGTCIIAWGAAAARADRVGLWPAIGGAAIALGAVVLVLDARSRQLLQPTLRNAALGAAVGLLMGAATQLLYAPIAAWSGHVAADAARLYAGFRGIAPALAALVLVPVVLGEELVWRGLVQSAFGRRLRAVPAALLAAAAYALAQVPLGSGVLVIVALACGAAWGLLRLVTGGLFAPLVAHLVWDWIVLLWRPLA